MQKVVVLYGDPTSKDISLGEIQSEWAKLSALPDVTYVLRRYDSFPTEAVCNRLVDADANAVLGMWITPKFLNEDFYASHPQLRYIAGLAHGYQEIDWALSRQHGITITNTPYGEHTIAEYAFALLLAICKQPAACCRHVKEKDWSLPQAHPYMYAPVTQVELYEKSFGVVGLGKIGYHAAKLAKAFGMRVLAYNRHPKKGPAYDFLEQVSLSELLAQADVVSLHIAMNAQTKGIINRQAIAQMKDGAILINTARGGLVDEAALAEALDTGKLYAAGLDVLVNEPPKADCPLLHCKNALITSHIAWMPKSCRLRQISLAIKNYAAYLAGRPVSVINNR